MPTRFLLSPARCDGRRAALLMNPSSSFPLAVRLRSEGVTIGEAFSFLSGLYFRGKLAYAEAFGAPLVITTDRGLVEPHRVVTLDDLRAFAQVDIATAGERHSTPLRRDAERLASTLDEHERVVLLGSIATGKYADTLIQVFGERLEFPSGFVGRGDMSRGGLLLRCVSERSELDYVPVKGAVRRGARPPKLYPATRPRR
jgi:hypothetical protein